MPIIIESMQEFISRQGCDYVVTSAVSPRDGEDAGWYLFANGARSNGQRNIDPPSDPRELAAAKCEYVRAKLNLEVREFHAYKAHVLETDSLHRRYPNLSAAPPNAPALLRAGQARIYKLREQLSELEAQLVSPEAVRRREDQERMRQEQASRNASIMSEVLGIDI